MAGKKGGERPITTAREKRRHPAGCTPGDFLSAARAGSDARRCRACARRADDMVRAQRGDIIGSGWPAIAGVPRDRNGTHPRAQQSQASGRAARRFKNQPPLGPGISCGRHATAGAAAGSSPRRIGHKATSTRAISLLRGRLARLHRSVLHNQVWPHDSQGSMSWGLIRLGKRAGPVRGKSVAVAQSVCRRSSEQGRFGGRGGRI